MKSTYRLQEYSDLAYPLVERLIRAGSLFIVAVVLARALGPGGYGEFSTALALYTLATSACSLGIAGTLSHAASKGKDPLLLINVIALRAFAGILLCIAAWPLVGLLNVAPSVYWLVAAGVVVFSLDSLDHYLQGLQRFKLITASKIAALTITSSLMIWLALKDRPVNWILAARFSEWPLVALMLANSGILVGALTKQQWRSSFETALRLASRSSPLIVSTISAAIYLRIDIIMLAWMSQPEDVAVYGVAAQLSEAWYLIPTAAGAFLLPHLTRIKELDSARYAKHLQRWSSLFIYSAIFVAIAMSIFAGPVVTLLFGEDYAPAVPILRIHVWSGVFVFFRVLVSKWIIIENIIPLSLKTQLLGAFGNVVLNLMLIPMLGGVGAALSTLVSYAFASYLGLKIWPQGRPAAKLFEHSVTVPFHLIHAWVRAKK